MKEIAEQKRAMTRELPPDPGFTDLVESIVWEDGRITVRMCGEEEVSYPSNPQVAAFTLRRAEA